MNVLTIQNLSKCLGKQKIIDNLNLSVPEGSVFGFIGKNGAGKTTTMKMVLGILQPDNGEISVCNEPVCFGQTRTNHILSDVERICDHAAFLNEGKIAVTGTLAEIKALYGHDSLLLEFSADKDLPLFKKQKSIEPLLLHSEENNRELILHSRDMVSVQKSLFRVLAETGICPVKIELMEPSLESLFLEVVK